MTVRSTEYSPRVLYIGDHPIGFPSSTGVTLEALYADYPQTLVSQYTFAEEGNTSFGKVTSVARFESPLTLPFSLALRIVRRLRPTVTPSVIGHNSVRVPQQSLTSRMANSLAAMADLAAVRLPRAKRDELKSGAPEVIHAVIGRIRTLKRVLVASRALALPIVPHFTDDWISTIFTNNELGGRARKSALALIDELMERSPTLLVIGETMAKEYSAHFNRECFVAAAPIDPDEYRTRYRPSAGPKRLVYVGSPLVGRLEVADRVAAIAKRRGWSVVVHPMMAKQWLAQSKHVELADQLEPRQVPSALRTADALLFPESTDPAIAAYTRLSVSTKLAQYVAAARPILAIGPLGQGSIEELRGNAPRCFLLHETSDMALNKGFDYLDRNLREQQVEIPTKYLAHGVRKAMIDAFSKAIDEFRPR